METKTSFLPNNNSKQHRSETGKNAEKIVAVRLFTSIINDEPLLLFDQKNTIRSKIKAERFLIDTGQTSDILSWSDGGNVVSLLEVKKHNSNPFTQSNLDKYKKAVEKGILFLDNNSILEKEFILLWIQSEKHPDDKNKKINPGDYLKAKIEKYPFMKIPGRVQYYTDINTLISPEFDDEFSNSVIKSVSDKTIDKYELLLKNDEFTSIWNSQFSAYNIKGIIELYEENKLFIDPKLIKQSFENPEVIKVKELKKELVEKITKMIVDWESVSRFFWIEINDPYRRTSEKMYESYKNTYIEIIETGEEIDYEKNKNRFMESFEISLGSNYYNIEDEDFKYWSEKIFKMLWKEIENED